MSVAIGISLLTLLLITRLNASTSTPVALHTPTATTVPTATTAPTVVATGTHPVPTVTPTVNVAVQYIVLLTTTPSPDTSCIASQNVSHFTAGAIVDYNFCLAPRTPSGNINIQVIHNGTVLTPPLGGQFTNTSGSYEGYHLNYDYGLPAGTYTVNALWNGQVGRTITFTVG